MKHILIALALLPFTAFAQTKGTYTINGKIGNLGAPAKMYLIYNDDAGTVTDSALIKNGNFTFTGKLSQPVFAMLLVGRQPADFERYKQDAMKKQEEEEVETDADVISFLLANETFSIESVDSIAKAKITGSKINEENAMLTALSEGFKKRAEMITAEAMTATEEQKQDMAYRKNIEGKLATLQKEYVTAILNFAKTHPESILSLSVITQFTQTNPDNPELLPAYNALTPDLKKSETGMYIKQVLDAVKLTGIGVVAPEFTQADTQGKPVKLSSFKGKYVLLDFWASWCGPCRQENPNVVAVYQKYKDKNFTVLGVSLDSKSTKDAWLKAIENDGLTWTQVSDLKYWQNEAAVLYGIKSIPQNILIGPDGKIVAKNLRGADLENKLREIFSM